MAQWTNLLQVLRTASAFVMLKTAPAGTPSARVGLTAGRPSIRQAVNPSVVPTSTFMDSFCDSIVLRLF